jgi:hypothetical protein
MYRFDGKIENVSVGTLISSSPLISQLLRSADAEADVADGFGAEALSQFSQDLCL